MAPCLSEDNRLDLGYIMYLLSTGVGSEVGTKDLGRKGLICLTCS